MLEKIIRYCYKNRTAKVSFKKVVHKTAEATGELIGNKVTEKMLNENECIKVCDKKMGRSK